MPARTAEALMRSRYTAFVRGDAAYLLRSWHPDTRPPALDVAGPRWTGLCIVATEAGRARDETGVVEFEARYEEGGRPGARRERSRFSRVDGCWVYVDGTAVTGA
jgi:SEC-C motif domain protein